MYSAEQVQAENIRKMLVAMAEDIRVVLIKLADRLHNMRTVEALPPERRTRMAQETFDIYAPLAHRLGMWQVKWELEDLAFGVINPEGYAQVVGQFKRKRKEREAFVTEVTEILDRELERVGIHADISGRPKHVYSIWQKQHDTGKTFDEIYDLIAIRVSVESIKDCYGVLGVIHSLWKPVPGRFKDYIAMPKSNGYQSLHTTVVSHSGDPMEIQIRTYEMHETAEVGVAAHWHYKEGGKADARTDEKFGWLRLLMEWQKDLLDAENFVDHLKVDIFQEEVFVFTPKGEVRSLPAGSTPDRLRLPHPHRGRPPLHRRQGQRPHGQPRHPAPERGHRRGADHQVGPRAQPRLAHLRQELLGAGKDPPVVQEGAPRREHHPRQGAAGQGADPGPAAGAGQRGRCDPEVDRP